MINQVNFEGNSAGQGHRPRQGSRTARTHDVHARQGAERRQPHHRRLPPVRILFRQGLAQDHPPAAEPRRSGVRDPGRRRDEGQAPRIRRQRRLRRQRPQGHRRHPGIFLVALLQPQRHLRSRPSRIRQGTAAPLLPAQRLRGRARGLGRCGAGADGSGFTITYTIEEGQRYKVADVAVNVGDAQLEFGRPDRQGQDRCGRLLRRHPRRPDGREPHARGVAPGLRLRARQPGHPAQRGRRDAQHHLQHRRRSAHLHRPDRHRRQHPHGRPGHPPPAAAVSRATPTTASSSSAPAAA